MGLFIASIFTIFGIEYIFRIPLRSRVKLMLRTLDKCRILIRSTKTSDHRKQALLLRYSYNLIRHTLYLGSMILGCFLLIFLPVFLIDYIFQFVPSTIDSFSSPVGLITIIVVSLIYTVIRYWFVKL